MLIATKTIIIACVILLLVSAGVITLEVYLSRRESKVPGLVLPGILFLRAVRPAERGSSRVFRRGNACGGLFERHPARVPHAAADYRADGGIFSLPQRDEPQKADREDEYSGFVSFSLRFSGTWPARPGHKRVDTCGFHPLVNHPFPLEGTVVMGELRL